MKKVLSIVIAMIMMLSMASTAFAANTSSFGAYKHVFIIGVDGAGGAFDKCDTPNFDRIFKNYTYTCEGLGEEVTVSAQNWGSILTGVAYDVHGWDNDYIDENERDSTSAIPSIFRLVKQANPDATFAAFSHWNPINHGIIENDLGVKKVHFATDLLVTDAFVNYFRMGNEPTLTFVQLDEVDSAGHSYGGQTEKYYNAVEKADKYIGRMYDAVNEAGLMDDGLFIVVSDHGEANGGGHGGNTPEEYTITVAAAGKTVADNGDITGARNRDVAAIALYALGVEPDEGMTAQVPAELFGELREDYNPNPETNIIKKIFNNIFARLTNFFFVIFNFDC